MNKSIKTVLMAIILVAAFLFGAAYTQAQNNSEVNNVFQKALKLNEGRFSNPNLILVGDTVLFPAHYGPGIEAWVADAPSEGKHDSFWRLSEKYVAGQLETVPADTMKVKIIQPVEETVEEAKENDWLMWLLIAIAFILTALFLVALFWNELKKRRNADNFPPVGSNIDTVSREQTLTSIMSRYLQPGERLISFRRGTLANSQGKRRFKAEMEFGDNVRRIIDLNAGERVSTAIIEDLNGNRRTQHLRNACSNGFGGGSFQLPNGWFIQYDETEDEGQVVTEDDGQGGQRPVVNPTNNPSAIVPTSHLQGGMNSLAQIMNGLSIDGNSHVEISLKEKKKEINLSIKVKRVN